MPSIDQYIEAATRENTRRAYRSAVEHFETHWGGFLPATSETMCRYLADHADQLSINTLKQRLAALAQWHIEQGFPDPTKAPMVKKVLKGIKALHPAENRQAKPLLLQELNQVVSAIDHKISAISTTPDANPKGLQLTRNKALVLIGFWRGFRSDELSRLLVEQTEAIAGQGISFYLPRSKGDRQNQGRRFKSPALTRLCPVSAYLDWIATAHLESGPVFRSIDRWGNLSNRPLNTNSITALLRKILHDAQVLNPAQYSSHSLRRGFASWANSNDWDIKTLMEYVGWKDIKSAMNYIDSMDRHTLKKIETAIQ